ncbi:hypothetical protein TRIADDRAFT_62991, partial [Trichoplax adhaerens]
MANTFNQILTSNGQKTGLYTNLLYNIRNQNFNGDEYGHANYLNYVNAAWQSGHHYAEVCTKQNGANWFFQEAGDNLYYIRNQNYNGDEYGNANYLNYKDKAWKNGHHYAEICAKQNGANWFFEATGKDMTYDTNKFLPLFYIRNQNYDGDEYGNVNYLNYKDYERSSGKHYAEIYTKEKGGSWFFEVDKSSYTVQVSVLSMKLAGEQSLDTLLSST